MKRSSIGSKTYEAALARRIAAQCRQREKAALSPRKPSLARRGLNTKPRTTRKARPTQRKSMSVKADPKLIKWGKDIKKRDGNKCQWSAFGPCATGDTRIDPHHIAPRGRRPDLKYVLANGVALCRTHHDWCHDNPVEAEGLGLLSSEPYEKANQLNLSTVDQ